MILDNLRHIKILTLTAPAKSLLLYKRIKAAAAAVGTVLPRLGYHSLGGRAKQLRRAVLGRSAAEEAPVLSPCRAAETAGGITAVNAGASAAHQRNTGLGGSPFGKSRTVRQGEEHSRGPAALREEVGFHWLLPNGRPKPNPNLNSVRLIAELVGHDFPGEM
ncbi:hypothetical protein J1605_010496 [Eschrichtius robustus]|uniref:Uncharacterized protein n=1 Tax=Eschrichtius robustus TaxID=9764 RepID=A0AB34GPH6_ESCRO|nr:hypothetical protein J1605_010496 [Eschrichtius robustus]